MSQLTINPYPNLGTLYSAGLDSIISTIGGSPTVHALVNSVYAYVNSIGWFAFTPGSLQPEIKSVAYSAVNSYVNGQVWSMYSGTQRAFVNDLISQSFIDNNTVDTISNHILDIQDNIPRRGMSIEAQTPLFFATMIGQTSYTYWLAQINSGGTSPWLAYLNPALVSATDNLPFYIAAGMEGSLIGARTTMIAPTIDIVSNQIICSLIGALTISAGKVIFGWIPRVDITEYKEQATLDFLRNSLATHPQGMQIRAIARELYDKINSNSLNQKTIIEALGNNDIVTASSLLGYKVEELDAKINIIRSFIMTLKQINPTIFGYYEDLLNCVQETFENMGTFTAIACAADPELCVIVVVGDCSLKVGAFRSFK